MKKLLIVLMSVMMLTLTACGSNEPNPNDALVEKYKPIIDALEAGDPETAILEVAKIANSIKEEAMKDATVVELTMDNFGEYFEVVSAQICYYNAFGEIDSVCTYPGLHIKDNYVGKIYADEAITCDVTFVSKEKKCDINLDTGEISNVREIEWSSTYERTEALDYYLDNQFDNTKTYPENTIINGGWSATSWKSGSGTSVLAKDADYYSFGEISDIVVNRVIGTIYILENN